MGENKSQVKINVLSLDVETQTSNKGNPFDATNFLVCVSWAFDGDSGAIRVCDEPEKLQVIQAMVDRAQLIVGFNFKFDLHWLLKSGIRIECPIWDCSNCEFVITRQAHSYPSLDECCEKYGLGKKIDIIKNEYWDRGINTDAIPWEILHAYAKLDAELTLKLYYTQLPYLTKKQYQLLKLLNLDLRVLQEMEANGMVYDESLCVERSDAIQSRMDGIKTNLSAVYPDIPINWNSGDHLSAFLYGGTIVETTKEFIGLFKTGAKCGQPRYKNIEVNHTLPRLYEPLKGSELKKEGFFATNEDTLLKLKGKQGPIKLMLEYSKLDKLNGTYYKGIPALNQQMNWPSRMIHGNFNQAVAQTGRLSSNKPNLQNFATDLQDIFVTRYADTM